MMTLIDRIQIELGAQEPWPKDVKLYQPYEVEQILLPDNANCLAVQAFLKMCNLDFQIVQRANAEYMSPTGKVPFIKAGAFVIPELEGVVQFVNSKGITLTGTLDVDQKSDMRAYMCLVHNVLENAELYICWCDSETYREVTKPRYGSVYPWPLNHLQTWSKKVQTVKLLKVYGWYEKSLQDVYEEVENCCQALSDRLEGRDYFFGDKFTEFDALVYGHIKAVLGNPVSTANKLPKLVGKYNVIIEHCKRIDSLIFGKQDEFNIPVTEISEEISRAEAELNAELKLKNSNNSTVQPGPSTAPDLLPGPSIAQDPSPGPSSAQKTLPGPPTTKRGRLK